MEKYHEAIVHFPIALLLTAFVFGLIGLFYRRGLFKEIVFWNLIAGVFATSAAIYTGLQESREIKDFGVREVLELHERASYTMALLATILTVWMGWRKRRMKLAEYGAWMSVFFIATASAGYQGYIGHEMSQLKTKKAIEASAAKTMTKLGRTSLR